MVCGAEKKETESCAAAAAFAPPYWRVAEEKVFGKLLTSEVREPPWKQDLSDQFEINVTHHQFCKLSPSIYRYINPLYSTLAKNYTSLIISIKYCIFSYIQKHLATVFTSLTINEAETSKKE